MSTTDDVVSSLTNASTLVFGVMGVGTFLIFFFAILILLIWIFSIPCATTDKVISRIVSVVLFVIVVLILIFAPQQSQYATSVYEVQVSVLLFM